MISDYFDKIKDAIDANILAEADAEAVHTAHLFTAIFTNPENGQDEVYYVTDNHKNVEYGANTYLALGHFIGYDGAESSAALDVATCRVMLSGVEKEYISAILSYHYINRDLSISRVFFNDAGQLIGTPTPVFIGPMDDPVINDDPTTNTLTVTLSASSHFATFNRRPGRHTNHQEQQFYFLGDQFFKLFGQVSKTIVWGR